MEAKKQYYGLDEIGFVGTQDRGSKTQVEKEIQMTVEYIKAQKSKAALSPALKKKRER